MSIEKGDISQEENSDIRFIKSMFTHAKLNHDYYNVWHKLPFNEEQWHEPIQPFQHYAELVRIRDAQHADLVIQLSDPEAVAAYDKLVDEFNAVLPEINRIKDFGTIKNFWEKARKLIYSEKE
jgi:hypothetical protein